MLYVVGLSEFNPKNQLKTPDFMENANITSIYKGRGKLNDLNNDRGIFLLSVLRTILDKLLYVDSYEDIERGMSDSNIGGRKNKNLSNHIFVANGIINEVKNDKKLCVDLELLDISKCFDSLWTDEIMNDMYDVMEPNDKLSLMYRENMVSHVAIKSPMGITERKAMNDIEMQGTVITSIKCSVQIDTLGPECLDRGEGMYKYKGCLPIPPLSLVDDVLAIGHCGSDSIKLNSIIPAYLQSPFLQYLKQ